MQQGQVFSKGPSNWAYRCRLGGRDSKRMQQSGFPTEEAAEQALDRALERARQEQGFAQTPTLSELVEIYLAQGVENRQRRRQLPRRPAPGNRARRAQRAPKTNRISAPLPRPTRRLPRPAQLPLPRLKPAQRDLGIDPIRSVYDLRHTFATFALRAGISTFDLSRYMGASLTMIDRHYGHLAKDGRQHAIDLLDSFNGSCVHTVGAKWTRKKGSRPTTGQKNRL